MDITNINALARIGSYPPSRTSRSGGLDRADASDRVAPPPSRPQVPAETVVQGELLQRRRGVPQQLDYGLLNAMRGMDQLLRQADLPAETEGTPARDARRALANYAANTLSAQQGSGTTAAVYIDYFV